MACDICMFAETRLLHSDLQSPNPFTIPTYHLSLFEGIPSPNSSNRTPYGLAVYSKLPILKSLQPLSMSPQSCNSECAIIQLALPSGSALNIACLYRRPDSRTSSLKTELQELLSCLNRLMSEEPSTSYKTIIIGDFNLDWLKDSTPPLMSDIFPAYRQLIDTVTTDYGSTLDHIYTDLSPSCITAFTTESYYSDHKPVVCLITDIWETHYDTLESPVR